MILKKDLLKSLPRSGTLVHPFLIIATKNRGANPLQWGIINQDDFADVSLHRRLMRELTLDPILSDQRKTKNFNGGYMGEPFI